MAFRGLITYATGSLSVRFDEVSMAYDEDSYLTDADQSTCTSFNLEAGAQVPLRTKFRIRLPEHLAGCLNVTLIGTHINCDGTFYVSPLSTGQAKKWTGRWSTCPLLQRRVSGENEQCFYTCSCRRYCEELQIIRMPSSVEDSNWTLCEVLLARKKCKLIQIPKCHSHFAMYLVTI